MKNLLLFILIITLSISCGKINDQLSIRSNITTADELTIALNMIHTNSEATGFAVSIVKYDKIIYQKSFGLANIESNQTYTNKTILSIGPVSKTLVGAVSKFSSNN